ncbi:MAG: ABC transporter permease [Armatimonadota bacterium]
MSRAQTLSRSIRARPWLALGLLIAACVIAAAVFAPWLTAHDPTAQLPVGRPVPPSAEHPLGTDSLGRDVLSRLLYGARLSLIVGLGAALLALALGMTVGVAAGYFGGWVEAALMRLTDVVMAFPAILLALAAAAVLPREGLTRSVLTLLLVIGLINWAGAARIFRSETLSLRERLYVDASRALGASHGRILFRHVLPHLLSTGLVVGSLGTATTILLDAGLAFLGVGVPAPHPTWGGLLQDAQQWYPVAPWLAVYPGLAVVLTVAAFNLIAFDLRRNGDGA